MPFDVEEAQCFFLQTVTTEMRSMYRFGRAAADGRGHGSPGGPGPGGFYVAPLTRSAAAAAPTAPHISCRSCAHFRCRVTSNGWAGGAAFSDAACWRWVLVSMRRCPWSLPPTLTHRNSRQVGAWQTGHVLGAVWKGGGRPARRGVRGSGENTHLPRMYGGLWRGPCVWKHGSKGIETPTL